jgi:hypothetical protein
MDGFFYLSQQKESGHFQGYLYIENGRHLATFYLAKKKTTRLLLIWKKCPLFCDNNTWIIFIDTRPPT